MRHQSRMGQRERQSRINPPNQTSPCSREPQLLFLCVCVRKSTGHGEAECWGAGTQSRPSATWAEPT